MRIKITICPNKLQVETVGSVTSPVTHTDVVAVKSASRKGTLSPVAELMGRHRRMLPMKITPKKLSKMVCVVENFNFFSFCKVLTSFHKKSTSPINNILNEQGLGGPCELAAAKASASLALTIYPHTNKSIFIIL